MPRGQAGAAQGAQGKEPNLCSVWGRDYLLSKGPPPISHRDMHAPPPPHSLAGEHCCYPHIAYEETEAQRVG